MARTMCYAVYGLHRIKDLHLIFFREMGPNIECVFLFPYLILYFLGVMHK